MDFTLESGATIEANHRGYRGGFVGGPQAGYGPGGGAGGGNATGGGGHGGRGGGADGQGNSGGVTNGLIHMPLNPGSGGGVEGGSWSDGGAGGGAVRINLTGHAALNGVIRANGQNANADYSRTAGGSGGSVYIVCDTFASAGGSLSANGGIGMALGGGGGGGRIALVFDTAAQALLPKPLLHISANRGAATANGGGLGTVYVSGVAALPETSSAFNGDVYNVGSWAPSQLALTNGWVRFMEPNFALAVTNDLRLVGTTARLDLYKPTLDVGGHLMIDNGQLYLFTAVPYPIAVTTVGGDFTMSNAARFHYYAGATNGVAPEYGALLDVTGDMTLSGTAIFYPYSMNTNGGSVKVTAANVNVGSGTAINADALGFLGRAGPGYGPGGGTSGGGGGYGGAGGKATGGKAYGVSNAPALPGSAGAAESTAHRGGNGGGLIWIEATGGINVSGTLTANGGPRGNWSGDAGGSGGGIFLTAQTFTGGGVMRANGSAGSSSGATGGGGGGGRIALIFGTMDGYLGTTVVNGGSGGAGNGGVGTVVRQLAGDAHLLTVIGDPFEYGAPTPYVYGQSGVAEDAWVTNSVASPANEAAGQRWACIGFSVTNAAGSVVASGVSTQAIFQMTEPLWQIWHWTNEYHLAASANVNGSLQVDRTGWYTNGLAVSLTAVPDSGHHFLQWSGSGVPSGAQFEPTLNLTMDRTRTVQANFAGDTPAARTWSGAGSWVTAANWSPAGVPGTADELTVSSGTLIIDDILRVKRFTVNAGTVEFRNWETRLNAGEDVQINGGTLTLPSAGFADNEMSNRVHIVARDFTLANGATINGASRGYRGVTSGLDSARAVGYGPGGGPARGGAGHASQGGNNGGPIYGVAEAPLYPGSSGGLEHGGAPGNSGAGGGAVLIDVHGILTLNGSISMNGGNRSGWEGNSGGSGGSIYLICRRLTGTTGSLSAHGGNAGVSGGGGSGGRVAVSFQSDDTDGSMKTGVNVNGGSGGSGNGGIGSIHWEPRPPLGTLILLR